MTASSKGGVFGASDEVLWMRLTSDGVNLVKKIDVDAGREGGRKETEPPLESP